MMTSIEELRQKLYVVLEKGSSEEVLMVSQELDVEIVKYMRSLSKKKEEWIEEKICVGANTKKCL